MFLKKLLPAFLCALGLGFGLSQCSLKKKKTAATPQRALPSQMMNQGAGLSGPGGYGPDTKLSYNKANVNGPYIAMTFDDGPHGSQTPRLLAMLRQRGIKATFYVVGNRCKMYQGVMRQISADGHEFGNHTWTHPLNPARWSDFALQSEITRTHDVIVSTSGIAPRSYRPPGGSVSAHQKSWLMSDYGYPTILWAVDPQDWKRPGPSVVTSRILTNTRPGSIVLAHDIHPPTIDAMPGTLDGLLARGFRFVTVSQLIALEQGRLASGGQRSSHGDDEFHSVTVHFSPGSF